MADDRDSEQRERFRAALELIKGIHRAGGIHIPTPEPPPPNASEDEHHSYARKVRLALKRKGYRPGGAHVSRGPGAMQKISRSGKHLGWWREGQSRGKPNARMPLEVDLRKREEEWAREIQRLGIGDTRRAAAAASVARKKAVAADIAARVRSRGAELLASGKKRGVIPSIIARELKNTPDARSRKQITRYLNQKSGH